MDSSAPPWRQQQQQRVTGSHKTKLIVFSLLILMIGLTIFVSATLSSLARTRLSSLNADPFGRSVEGSSIRPRLLFDYCYQTAYPQLCFISLPAFVKATADFPKPGEVVSAAIRAAVHGFKAALPDGGQSECGAEVQRSISRLNQSLAALGVDSDLSTLSYEEMDLMVGWIAEAASIGAGCLREMGEVGGVGSGVRRASHLAINAMGLVQWRDYLVLEVVEKPGFYRYFGDGSMVLWYVVMYLLIALLYLLFWDM